MAHNKAIKTLIEVCKSQIRILLEKDLSEFLTCDKNDFLEGGHISTNLSITDQIRHRLDLIDNLRKFKN